MPVSIILMIVQFCLSYSFNGFLIYIYFAVSILTIYTYYMPICYEPQEYKQTAQLSAQQVKSTQTSPLGC